MKTFLSPLCSSWWMAICPAVLVGAVAVRRASAQPVPAGRKSIIKSTSAARPCRDISAVNCKLSTRTNAIKLGTVEQTNIQLPEKEAAYPAFDTFGKIRLAYGIYARHVQDIKFQNVQSSVLKPDARPATIFIDVGNVTPANFPAATPAVH